MTSRCLISTIAISPRSGGVSAMTRFVVGTLRDAGIEPVLACYQPYSVSPELSVPLMKLGQRRPESILKSGLDNCECHAIGCWLPELEFTHYRPSTHWEQVMQSCDHHLCVSGTLQAALPMASSGRDYLAWTAAGWEEDRIDRVARFPWYRRLLDIGVNAPVLRRLERRLLRSGRILALSAHTRDKLNTIAGSPVVTDILPMPVDVEKFSPKAVALVPCRIGFSGRLADPRKNLSLLLDAFAQVIKRVPKAELVLIGGESSPVLDGELSRLGIADRVRFTGYLQRADLAMELQSLDVYALPSHQEGLCIAALEAMACGCPVVSTPCGGPQEFVIDDETGYVSSFDSPAFAERLMEIISNRSLRQHLGEAARERVVSNYTARLSQQKFWDAWNSHINPTGGISV